MRVAVVENNVITNVIIAERPDGKTTFELPHGKWVGDLYADAPSQLDILEAQVTYTAMMTDTLLEV